MELVTPSERYLPSYVAAIERGFSPDTQRPEAAAEVLAEIARDPGTYLRAQDDRAPVGQFVKRADGSLVVKIPGYIRWMWDGEFAGYVSLRWQDGTAALPEYVPGHIGYAVVPWKQRLGYATEALRLILDDAVALGLPWADLTTESGNLPSQRVILANGGELIGEVADDVACGRELTRKFRIDLAGRAA